MPFVGCCALVYFWTLRFSRIGDFYTLRLGFFGNLDLRIIHAQCIGSLRYKYTRQTAHLLYPLEVNLRSKEQSILLRIDTHPQFILARLEENRFQSVGKSEKTPTIERRNLCRRCYKRFTRQQTFRFSVSNPGDVIHRAFHIIDMKHSIINCTNTLRQTSEIYGTNQTLNTTLHLSEEKFFVLLPENL